MAKPTPASKLHLHENRGHRQVPAEQRNALMKISLKKKIAAAAAAATIVGGVGIAYGYWTSTGAGDGSATTGGSTDWAVTTETSGGPLYPGSGSETVSYTVTNNSAGHQGLNAVAVTVDADVNGDVLSTAIGNPAIEGCKAAWFAVTDTDFDLQDLAGGEHYDNSSTIVLNNTPTTIQDACKNASFTVTASAS